VDAAGWHDEGIRLADLGRLEEARSALRRSVDAGGGADALAALADVRFELGDTDGAAEDLERAVALRPEDPAIALLDATFLPWVYRDNADLERWRSRYTDRLEGFARHAARYRPQASLVLDLARSNFLLAYQGRDDVGLQRTLGSALRDLLRHACPRFLEPRKRVARSRIRVGFASAFLYDCTVGRYFGSWIEGLGTAKFEVVGFMLGAVHDGYTARLARSCVAMHALHAPVLDVAQRIVDADLDILIYPEVGMEPRTRLLSCLRLAPVQLAAWGHPETTGSPEIDAYLSCETMEGPGAAAHYTEKLLPLPGLGVRYEPPSVPLAFTREELGIEPGRTVYGCPQSIFKLHPDSDALFADILERDPRAVLLLFQGQNASPEPAKRRVASLAGALAARGLQGRGQLRLLAQLSPVDFRRALQAMEVVIDPPHWSGGNTALEALAMGVPVVAMPGALMRSRQAAAMLQALGADECVAATSSAAADTAVRIAADAGLRRELAGRIRESRGHLFDDPAPVRSLQAVLGSI
jgi:CRISPR-associated protein Csy1